MFKLRRALFIFILLSFSLLSCKHKSIIIIKKEVKMQLPGRLGSPKAAHYKVSFIPRIGSDQLSFQKIMLNEKELALNMFDNNGQKLTAFNPSDTVNLFFSNIGNEIQSLDITDAKFVLFFFEKNKLKKTIIEKFEIINSPINQ
jgi:hypothetical protein